MKTIENVFRYSITTINKKKSMNLLITFFYRDIQHCFQYLTEILQRHFYVKYQIFSFSSIT